MTGNALDISEKIKYIGVDDHSLDLFESQYAVPNGITYNSYVITDEKTAVVDTTDNRTGATWLENLKVALGSRNPDFLVIEHLEPDHSSLISDFIELYPDATLVMSATARRMLPEFLDNMPDDDKLLVMKEGDTLDLGTVSLKFFLAPMVHWPEVMMAYCPEERTLFTADAFGTFGTSDAIEGDWATEARRYYYNIVGKYGAQVQTLLKKLSGLDIRTICPLHGPILKDDISRYLNLYDTWSRYLPETDGVFVACASIHGNTMKAAERIAMRLREKGIENVYVADLTRDDKSAALALAFRYPTAVFCASSYDAGLFTPMFSFLHALSLKGYRNRTAAIVENGSWAPSAGNVMREMLGKMKDIRILPDSLTIRGAFKKKDRDAADAFADAIAASIKSPSKAN